MQLSGELKYKEYFTMEIEDLGTSTIITSHLNIERNSYIKSLFLTPLAYTTMQKAAAGISKEHGCAFS